MEPPGRDVEVESRRSEGLGESRRGYGSIVDGRGRRLPHWGITLAVAVGGLAVGALLYWALVTWLMSGEPTRMDLAPLDELAEDVSVVRDAEQACPGGSPPAEPCQGWMLARVGQSVASTQQHLVREARSMGFREVEILDEQAVFRGRRDDLCLDIYGGPNPFRELRVSAPAGTVAVWLSYC